MKKVLFWSLLLLSQSLLGQITASKDTVHHWKVGGFMSLAFNQVSFSNWAAGGENSISATALASFFANYKKETTTWDNNLDLGYGFLKPNESKLRKNEDKIDLTSKYGKLAKGKFYYSGLLNFKSQMDVGYNFPNDSVITSNAFAPAFLTAALGMDYKPNTHLTVFLSPATGKFTYVNDQRLADLGSFGVDKAELDPITGAVIKKGKKFRPEFGAYFRVRYQDNLITNVNLATTLQLFNNYTDKNIPNRQNIDINWETLITIKANKYLTTAIFTHLIYDQDIEAPIYVKENGVKKEVGKGPRTQFKQTLGIGLSYKF